MPDSTIPFDHPPVGGNDTVSVAAGQSVFIDILANDSDPDPGETANLGFTDITVLSENGQPAPGTLQQVLLPNGHIGFKFTANDPYFDTGSHTLTFTYRVVDQWYSQEDPSTYANARSAPVTVTINVTGNAVLGETIYGTNHPQILTPANPQHDARIHFALQGNDVLFGGNSGDTIDGSNGSDTIDGDNGKDSLAGGAGIDLIYGSNGDDTIDGGSGGDLLFGGNGADEITGGAGNDTISGGLGSDDFYFRAGSGRDVITDFDTKNETIYLDHNFLGSYGGLLANAHNVGRDLVITSADGQDSITLVGVQLNQLRESDFIFT